MSGRDVWVWFAMAAGLLAVGLYATGLWVYAAIVLIVLVWLALSIFGFRWIFIRGKSLEKAGQSSWFAFPLILVGMFTVGGVLMGGPFYGLPGQLVAAVSGDRLALGIVAGKFGLLCAGWPISMFVISKGSKL